MFDDHTLVEAPLGYLLLRDGHAVPLTGLSPDALKAGAKHLVPNPDVERLRHKQTLNAIVDRLGFDGDFGDYVHKGWPALQAFLTEHGCTYQPRFAAGEAPGYRQAALPEGCTHRVGLFPADHGGCIDLLFVHTFGPTRRQLADRVFESALPRPERVFLGHGVDWRAWDSGDGHHVPEAVIETIGGDPATARARAEALFALRLDLKDWGFLGDTLIWGPVERIVTKLYSTLDHDPAERQRFLDQHARAVRAFRAVFDASELGWVDVLPFNARLVVLRAHDGAWDLLWRGYRASEPPKPEHITSKSRLQPQDQPLVLQRQVVDDRALHLRQEVWEEHEAHAAEQAFYDRGGTMLARQLAPEAAVRVAWLREQGVLPPKPPRRWTGPIPEGFREVEVEGQRLAVSGLIDLASFQRMCAETGYLARRPQENEPWERANEGVAPSLPVGLSWADAQAWCAWRERALGVPVRLLSREEHRALRPFYSAHYERLSLQDFPWESHPPRPLGGTQWGGPGEAPQVPSAVLWSEPRFLEPGPDRPALPPPDGWSTSSRKRWITDFPPRAGWQDPLPWAEHSGLRYVDAWDCMEWCQEQGFVSGRFWEGPLGGWGAYKNAKVCFRVAFELGE